MAEASSRRSLRAVLAHLRWIHLAPLLALLALSAWAFASPIGAGPDDDYHLISTWCASGGSDHCEPGLDDNTRIVPTAFPQVACYAQHDDRSAECQESVWGTWDHATVEITRGNFVGEYPPVYYATMRAFAGSDVQASALVMRIVNAVLFVGLATALAALLPAARRTTLLWGWLVTLVPLGMFIIPSNNPSGWAVMGVGTAFLALLGWFETTGRRRWALAALYLIGVIMAGGARGDAAVYVAGATVSAALIALPATRAWWRFLWLPLLGLVLAVGLFSLAGQTGVVGSGFGADQGFSTLPGPDGQPLGGIALAAYNLLMLPFLWTGVWGTWALGWFDTQLPAIVPWAAVSAFVVVAFAGLGRMNWRKAVTATCILIVLIVLPVYVLTTGGDTVGENLQPRYLLPVIVLFAFVLLTDTTTTGLRFTRLQTFAIVGALVVANLVALQINIRRYVTGVDRQGIDLDTGAEWWWTGFPVGPTAVWVIGMLAYAGLIAVLWPSLRRPTDLVTG
ncbi:MAG: DUF2142 domain-containing protein [Pseudolysinimonas sp.]|uniref:DUF2142 domain-containing protein n=1 Tax=Pseudolysinimonas sp. TaxID=2680009 RepID=UPI003C76D1B8